MDEGDPRWHTKNYMRHKTFVLLILRHLSAPLTCSLDSPKCSQYVQHIFLSSWSFEMRAETACDKHKKYFIVCKCSAMGKCMHVVGRFVMQLIIMNWFFKHIYWKTISCHCNFSSVFTFYWHILFLGEKIVQFSYPTWVSWVINNCGEILCHTHGEETFLVLITHSIFRSHHLLSSLRVIKARDIISWD